MQIDNGGAPRWLCGAVVNGFCGECWHNWYAHDDGDDDYDWCRIEGCACDGYVLADDRSIAVNLSWGGGD